LSADSQNLRNIGSHLIVGYRNFEEIKLLVNKDAVAGIFLSQRNVKNRSKEQITKEIAQLQSIRFRHNLPKLFITTDFEGGLVSRLSPPLAFFPSLGEIVKNNTDKNKLETDVRDYASKVGSELSEIGVNVNFSPVVDLDFDISNPADKFSKISDRAISSDPEVVSQASNWYCDELIKKNVSCTIKHFPGLGRIYEDTHVENAKLTASVDELNSKDWLPFKEVSKNESNKALIMLGHAKLTAIDENTPASFSKDSLGLFRGKINSRSVSISDDFSMYPVSKYKLGIGFASQQSLQYGNDLILIAYDPDLYWPVMSHLLGYLDKKEENKDFAKSLEASKERLKLYYK
jgi:beta-N-acetylhexosaminidase